MKNFLSKYWKRILILIASVFIIINIVNKCVAPHTLIGEIAEYGPDISSSQEKENGEDETTEKSGENLSDSIVNNITENSPFNGEMVRIIAIFAIALIGVCVISDLANKKSSGGKKK